MESTLGALLQRAKENSPRDNASKTELILFTRKCKVPSFRLPRLDDITLQCIVTFKRNKIPRFNFRL